MPPTAKSRPANAPCSAVKATTSSTLVPTGLASVATRRGSVGSVASSTATPLLSGLGQKRVLEPLAKSEKPQLPT